MRNPIFRSKKPVNGASAPADADVAKPKLHKAGKGSVWRGYHDRSMAEFPGILPWLKTIWPDIIAMLCIAAVALGFNALKPPYLRLFPVTFQNGQIVNSEIAYPYRKPVLNSAVAGIIVAVIPIACFIVMQWRIRRFWDLNNAIVGLAYALLSGSCFQVMIKSLIGGLRPHFLSVCKPDMALVQAALAQQPGNVGFGFQTIYFDRKICRGLEKEINNALISFPSGHTEAAFAGFGFLYLYFNAKFKVFSNYQPRYWKIIITYMPILGAVLIAGNLVMTYNHHYYDVIGGGIIGMVFAFTSYRAMYAAIWDHRFNHIPLMRHVPFHYSNRDARYAAYYDCTWTRKAEWGLPVDELGGAPGDAAYGLDVSRVRGDMAGTAHNGGAKDPATGVSSSANRDGDIV